MSHRTKNNNINITNSPLSNYNNTRRRGSDSIRPGCPSPFGQGQGGPVRRNSLTPILTNLPYPIPSISIQAEHSDTVWNTHNISSNNNKSAGGKVRDEGYLCSVIPGSSTESEPQVLTTGDRKEGVDENRKPGEEGLEAFSPSVTTTSYVPTVVRTKTKTRRGAQQLQLQQQAKLLQSESPFQIQVHGKEERRKSSSSRYDFDDDFMEFVTLRCNLELKPDEILGRGSFGTVIAGDYHGQSVAVKVINTKSRKHIESMAGEENAMSLPSNPNIVHIIDIFQLGPERSLVVMELLRKGNLLFLLNDPKISIDFTLRVRLCREISSALLFCHHHGILHLDVKPQNILIDFQDHCKLSDFGNSRKLSDLAQCSDFTQLDGTVAYKAPELFRGIRPTTKCDVYSLGISMWQILTRETPYQAETNHSIIYKVVAQGLRPLAKYSVVSTQQRETKYVRIYEQCWKQEEKCRPEMKTVMQKLFRLQWQR